ncbi:MAG: YcfL family protein [Smithella sp.]
MKNYQRLLPAAFMIVFLFFMTSCSTAQTSPDQTVTLSEFFAVPTSKLSSTADSIVVRGARTAFTKGFMRVDFKIFNERGRRNVINYRMRWLDRDGLMAAPYDAWSTIAFEGQQETVITAVCPNDKAVDYILEIRTN